MKNTTNYSDLSMDEIIFDGRNKAYGAYELRESYNRRIRQALLGSLLLTVMACGYQSVYAMLHATPLEITKEIHAAPSVLDINKPKIADVEPVRPKHVDPPKPKGTPDPPTVKTVNLTPSASANTADTVPTNAQLAMAMPGDHNSPGTTGGTNKGDEKGELAMIITKPAPAESPGPRTWAEVMPEYPGGEKAMMEFITRTIDYPDMDQQMGNQGKVFVSFIIDEEGAVTNIGIQKGLTRTLNEESVRVVSKLKRFKPAMQGGQRVRVRYTLPILYRLD